MYTFKVRSSESHGDFTNIDCKELTKTEISNAFKKLEIDGYIVSKMIANSEVIEKIKEVIEWYNYSALINGNAQIWTAEAVKDDSIKGNIIFMYSDFDKFNI